MNRGTRVLLPIADVINISGPEQDENDPIFIDRLPVLPLFPACAPLRWLPVFAALAAVAAPDCRRRRHASRAAGAYDGTWNVVFATTRGNCSSGYSVPFTVRGSRVSSAGGGRVSGSVNRAGAVAVRCFGRRIQGEWRRPARRHQRRGLMARHHHRRSLQRHLAGHAELVRVAVACSPDGAQRNPGGGAYADRPARIALRSIRATKTKTARQII